MGHKRSSGHAIAEAVEPRVLLSISAGSRITSPSTVAISGVCWWAATPPGRSWRRSFATVGCHCDPQIGCFDATKITPKTPSNSAPAAAGSSQMAANSLSLSDRIAGSLAAIFVLRAGLTVGRPVQVQRSRSLHSENLQNSVCSIT